MGNSFSKKDRHQRRYSWDENVDTVLLNFFNFLTYSDRKFLAKKPSHYLVTQALKENFRWQGHGPEKINIIHYAAAKASVDGVQYIIKVGADVNRKTEGGLTALHFAVVFKNFKVIETLVAFGADINAQANHNGYTPLHYACRDKDILTVKMLIRLGADSDVQGNAGETPIDIARKLACKDIVKVLMIHKEKFAEKDDEFETVEDVKQITKSRIPNGNILSRQTVDVHNPITSIAENKQTPDTFLYQEAVKIQENYETFLEYLTNTNDIINKLFTAKHIHLQYKEYLQQKDEHTKNEEMLSHIMKGNQAQYLAFISALKETGNSELANLLAPTMHAPINVPQVVHVDFTPQAVSSVSTGAVLHGDSNKRIMVSNHNDFQAVNGVGYRSNTNFDQVSEIPQGQGHVSRVYINKAESMKTNTYQTKIPDENHNTIVSMQNVHTAGIEDEYDRSSGYAHRSMENLYPRGVNYTLRTGDRGYRQTIGTTGRQNLLMPQSNQVRILNGAPGSQPVYVLRHHSVSSGNRRELESIPRSRRDYDTMSSYASVF